MAITVSCGRVCLTGLRFCRSFRLSAPSSAARWSGVFPSSGSWCPMVPRGAWDLENSWAWDLDLPAYDYGSKPWYLVNPKIAGKWMFIPLKMVSIGIDPYPYVFIMNLNPHKLNLGGEYLVNPGFKGSRPLVFFFYWAITRAPSHQTNDCKTNRNQPACF